MQFDCVISEYHSYAELNFYLLHRLLMELGKPKFKEHQPVRKIKWV